MSRFYHNYDERQAYEKGREDERYRRYDYGRSEYNDSDRPYFEGKRDERRDEERRREEREMEEQEERRAYERARERRMEEDAWLEQQYPQEEQPNDQQPEPPMPELDQQTGGPMNPELENRVEEILDRVIHKQNAKGYALSVDVMPIVREVARLALESAEKEIEELKKEREILVWNLAGCSTYALGYNLDDGHSEEWARPALNDVKKLALRSRSLQNEVLEEAAKRCESIYCPLSSDEHSHRCHVADAEYLRSLKTP